MTGCRLIGSNVHQLEKTDDEFAINSMYVIALEVFDKLIKLLCEKI